jgi:hypothetical protein
MWPLAPALQGIYASPPAELSASALFGKTGAARQLTAPARGMGEMIDRLHERLRARRGLRVWLRRERHRSGSVGHNRDLRVRPGGRAIAGAARARARRGAGPDAHGVDRGRDSVLRAEL